MAKNDHWFISIIIPDFLSDESKLSKGLSDLLVDWSKTRVATSALMWLERDTSMMADHHRRLDVFEKRKLWWWSPLQSRVYIKSQVNDDHHMTGAVKEMRIRMKERKSFWIWTNLGWFVQGSAWGWIAENDERHRIGFFYSFLKSAETCLLYIWCSEKKKKLKVTCLLFP